MSKIVDRDLLFKAFQLYRKEGGATVCFYPCVDKNSADYVGMGFSYDFDEQDILEHPALWDLANIINDLISERE